MDPLAEVFDDLSPYNYGLNNPVRYIDPDGMAVSDTIVMVPDQPLPERARPGDIVIDDQGKASTLLPSATARPLLSMSMAGSNISPYSGPLGVLRFILSGGEENGYRYDINGRNLGPLPNMGYPMDFSRGNPRTLLGVFKIFRKKFVKDFATKNTKNFSSYFKSEREARNLARRKLGRNPIEVEPNKWRSADGKWQYRAKSGDVNERHIHIEELDPTTGEVLQNYHLRW